MTIVKIGQEYFNFKYFQRAEIHSNGNVTLSFLDKKGTVVYKDLWFEILKKLEIDVVEIGEDDQKDTEV